MRTIALSEAKDRLSALVEDAATTHEIIQITKHGHPAAVLMAADDLEALHETLHALSTPGVVDELAQALDDHASGATVSGESLRLAYGLKPR